MSERKQSGVTMYGTGVISKESVCVCEPYRELGIDLWQNLCGAGPGRNISSCFELPFCKCIITSHVSSLILRDDPLIRNDITLSV